MTIQSTRSSPRPVQPAPADSAPVKLAKPKKSGRAAKRPANKSFDNTPLRKPAPRMWPKTLKSPLEQKADREPHPPGSYGGGRALVTTPKGQPSNRMPSGANIEVDHMTPKSLHTSDKMTAGQLENALPAAGLNVTEHRRKLTTGSGPEVEHHRDYLLAAHHGYIPFAGPMETQQDHYGAAMQIDIAGTTTASTLFGEKTLHDQRSFTAPTHLGDVPIGDARQGLTNQKTMVDYAHSQGLINKEGRDRTQWLLNETDKGLEGLYGEHGKPIK